MSRRLKPRFPRCGAFFCLFARPRCARPCGQPHSGPSHVALPPPARGQVRRSGLVSAQSGPDELPRPRFFPAWLFFGSAPAARAFWFQPRRRYWAAIPPHWRRSPWLHCVDRVSLPILPENLKPRATRGVFLVRSGSRRRRVVGDQPCIAANPSRRRRSPAADCAGRAPHVPLGHVPTTSPAFSPGSGVFPFLRGVGCPRCRAKAYKTRPFSPLGDMVGWWDAPVEPTF